MNIIGDGEMVGKQKKKRMGIDIYEFFPYIILYEYLYYSYTI